MPVFILDNISPPDHHRVDMGRSPRRTDQVAGPGRAQVRRNGMSIATSVGGVRAVGVAALASLALTVACGGSPAPAASSKPCSSTSSDRWSAQTVKSKTAPYNVTPIYDVPKNLTNCTIGFINPA